MELPQAPATFALILANLIASIYALNIDRSFAENFAFRVDAIVRDKQHYRVFTSSFLHGDYFHLLFNLLTLFYFGPVIERILGIDGFLVVYFGAVFAGGVISFFVNRNNPAYTSLGASDGVAGVVLSFCVFFPLERIYIFFIPIGIPAILFGAIFIAISAGMMGRAGGRIAHEAHLGGALAGVLLTLAMRPDVLGRLFA
ncbi:MAG: rhomboid family intramembrane serine protease [Pseudomonadota bacterium]